MRAHLLVLIVAGCSSKPMQPALVGDPFAGGIAPLPEPGDRAFVADARGLVEVALSGASQVIANGQVDWCSADAKARVIWFVGEFGLEVLDLDDRKRYPIVLGSLAGIDINIVHGKLRRVHEPRLDDDPSVEVLLSVEVADKPSLVADVVCEDAQDHCYRPGTDILLDEIEETYERAKELKLADEAYVAALAARAAAGRLWMRWPAEPPQPNGPEVERARCSNRPHECGSLQRIPNTPLWLAVTANSVDGSPGGQQQRELWDPDTQQYVRIVGDKLVRSHELPSDDGATDYLHARVSPSGVVSHRGVVFTSTRVIYAPSGKGITCGFANGGWRL